MPLSFRGMPRKLSKRMVHCSSPADGREGSQQ